MPEVFAVYKIVFKINNKTKETPALETVSDIESLGLDIGNGIEEWSPIDQEGWVRKMATAKNFVLAVSGKRSVGDSGNDYVAGMAFKLGSDVATDYSIEFPDGSTTTGNCIIEVTNVGDGASTNIGQLVWNLHSDGKPTYTPGA